MYRKTTGCGYGRGGPQNHTNRGHNSASSKRPVDGVDTTSPIAAQQSLEKAIDAANQATLAGQPTQRLKAAHNHVSDTLGQCAEHLGLMQVDLLKKIHDYLQQKHHARGLNQWFHGYLAQYHADHLKLALNGGDLLTLEWLLEVCEGKLSAWQITQVSECAASHYQAASQSTDDHATLVARQAQRLMAKTGAPMPRQDQRFGEPLKNDSFDLTQPQKSYASGLADKYSPQIEAAYGTTAKTAYQELTQFVAYLWTVPMNTLLTLQSLLAEHKVKAPLNAGLTTLCLLWSEDQITFLKPFLDNVIGRAGDHPGFDQARQLIAKTGRLTGDTAEQLYLLLNKGTPQDILGLLRDNPWLPVALMKRAWTDPQYGHFIQQLHELAGQWQGDDNDKELQAWGAALKTLLPPAPMPWVSAQDFIGRLVHAVKNRQLAEIDFALASRHERLRASLDAMALDNKLELEAVFATLLNPGAPNSLLPLQDKMEKTWLSSAGFKQMEYHVSLMLTELQNSIKTHRH